MKWLCNFARCRWRWVFNAQAVDTLRGDTFGVYQCRRCKTISVGSRR